MFLHFSSLRIRYAETDQMGVVYYGNYPQYFEVGRVEALRSLGMSYKQMEEDGIMLPVLDLKIKYLKPATYDDLIQVKTEIRTLPSARITFFHELYNEKKELLTQGSVQLVFIKKDSRRPCAPPQNFMEKISPFFS